jgi:hypothetical protein
MIQPRGVRACASVFEWRLTDNQSVVLVVSNRHAAGATHALASAIHCCTLVLLQDKITC